jgi:hypothetical protein
MEYIHETIDSERLQDIFNLPVSLQNTRVEIIIKPFEETRESSKTSAYGCLRRYANREKITGEKGAWERAAVVNYAKS